MLWDATKESQICQQALLFALSDRPSKKNKLQWTYVCNGLNLLHILCFILYLSEKDIVTLLM